MIISRVIQAKQLTGEHKGRRVILRRARTNKGHQFQDLVKGVMTGFVTKENNQLVLLITDKDGKNIDALVDPEWAVIFPIDGAGHTW